ncbi:dihydroxyacetone phosphate acyltransferase isoform X2 [Adelges cooleyi]|nr:dihydroxyacetone phosphate acyltransferase isoform X2 [Adelges cooleyi]
MVLGLVNDLKSTKNYVTIRMLGYILIKILKSKLGGLYINEMKLVTMKHNFHQNPVIFVPSHRSYQDFILMAFICFHYDIEVPYVAAAMDFKNMKIMGNLLKQCGAFFLRRNKAFQNTVYRSALYAYVKHLLVYETAPLQFFIEGTRSRANKSIPPKFGLLKCIVDTLLNNEVQDITLVSISINYDRLLEDKLFGYELLGIPKPKETTMGLISSIKNMDGKYGNVYVNFSSPLSVRQYVDETISSDCCCENDVVKNLAYEIMFRQQHDMVLSYVNILAVALNYNLSRHSIKTVQLDIVVNQINWIKNLLRKCGARIENINSDDRSRIVEIIQLHHNYLILKDDLIQFRTHNSQQKLCNLPDGNLNFYMETFDNAFPLILNQLYVNPTMHFFVNVAFISVVINCEITWKNNLLDLRRKYILLRWLFEYEFAFSETLEIEDFKNSIALYRHVDDVEKQLLRYSIIHPFLTGYHLIYDVLKDVSSESISDKRIYKLVYLRIQERLLLAPSELYSNSNLYCLSKDLIKFNLEALEKMGVIRMTVKSNESKFYQVTKTLVSELSSILDNIITSNNNNKDILKSKI